jgi:peptidoglycan/LPS O-acetylase OafA/YrhL
LPLELVENASLGHALTTEKYRTIGRLSGLDCLRGIAILLVMVGHFIPQAFPNAHFPVISTFGGGGVLLFFCLSGFLIFKNLQSQPAAVFLVRRLFKLMPMYWINVLAVVGMAKFLQIGNVPDPMTIIYNLLMVQDVTQVDLLSGVYWTLLIEVKFYFVMVVFCSIVGTQRIYWLLIALLAINMVVFYFLHRGSVLTTYLIAFFPGIIAAKEFSSGMRQLKVVELFFVGTVVALNLYICLPIGNAPQAIYSIVATALLLVALHQDFHNIFLSFFGKISYSHYLFHAVIGYPLLDYLSSCGRVLSPIAALCVASIVTVGIATVSFYFIETPAVKFGHSFSKASI